ncbi:hypothetical protein [Microlunatus parietis]|uniref:Uncharacterized protein n=1 Tax=Microlunatus parietis TaxID=682979 RepID=A0A7Y9IE00_9ACTN|nr:hypothetical protein [Microlunatus parietis]NYE74783.1 hypothetical protein [Microlunatus parietis]
MISGYGERSATTRPTASATAAARTATSAQACRSDRSGAIPRSHQSRSRSNDQAVAQASSGRTSNRSTQRPGRPQRGW